MTTCRWWRALRPGRRPGRCRWWKRRKRPLILAGELGRQRIIWIGFDILESNWPLRVSFPIFIANAVEWLNPANARSGQLLVKAGDPFRLPLLEPATSAQVTLPDGATKALKLDPTANELVFGDTYKAGVYRLRLGTNDTVFCVNLLDAAESNIKPRDALQLGKYTKVSATTTTAGEHGIVAHDCRAWAVGVAGRVVVLPSEDGVRRRDLRFMINDLRVAAGYLRAAYPSL